MLTETQKQVLLAVLADAQESYNTCDTPEHLLEDTEMSEEDFLETLSGAIEALMKLRTA